MVILLRRRQTYRRREGDDFFNPATFKAIFDREENDDQPDDKGNNKSGNQTDDGDGELPPAGDQVFKCDRQLKHNLKVPAHVLQATVYFVSLNSTCLRTVGSNFVRVRRSGVLVLFFSV